MCSRRPRSPGAHGEDEQGPRQRGMRLTIRTKTSEQRHPPVRISCEMRATPVASSMARAASSQYHEPHSSSGAFMGAGNPHRSWRGNRTGVGGGPGKPHRSWGKPHRS